MINSNLRKAVFTTKDIVARKRPILYVIHDVDDDWQFLTGEDVTMEDMMMIAMEEVINIDASVMILTDIKKGYEALRTAPNLGWQIQKSQ